MLVALLLSSLIASRPDTNPAPSAPIHCKMNNGQPRPFACEFQIQTVYFLGENNELKLRRQYVCQQIVLLHKS
jgi:hypothetical protein